MSYPDHDAFSRHCGPGWTLRADAARTLDVQLLAAEALPAPGGPAPAGGGAQGFSLVFQTPPGEAISQGTYEFAHEGLGRMQIFVVPIGADDEGMRIQAIFT